MQYIELDDRTADELAGQAAARGLTVAEFLKQLIGPTNGHSQPSVEQLEQELDALLLDLPTLPNDFSRADIYDEHD